MKATQFLRFLKDNDVSLHAYLNNVKCFKQRCFGNIPNIQELLQDDVLFHRHQLLLITIFNWSFTKEGPRYWLSINKKWMQLIHNI